MWANVTFNAKPNPLRPVPAGEGEMTLQKPIVYLMTACASLEFLMWFVLSSLGKEVFTQWIWTPDSHEYARVAQHVASTFQLTSSHRTLGYPLFLSLGYVIGGQDYWMHVTIVLQLILNLVFTLGCWRLIERVVPAVGTTSKVMATLFFFWAALGMAFFVMTDFLASFLFWVFLYGLLFWRTPSRVVLAGSALAAATFTRPTFTFLPFLLPIASLLVARATTKVPLRHIFTFMALAAAATGISVACQYRAFGYLGPSPGVLTENIETTLYYALVEGRVAGSTEKSYVNELRKSIEQRVGRPYTTLSLSEQESNAKQVFLDNLTAHPKEIAARLMLNFFKYLFVPVEANVLKATTFYLGEQTYFTYVRPILMLSCLPIWLLSLAPPLGPSRELKTYYSLVIVLVFYVIGVSAITNFGGERMRFPVLVAMMPVLAWNLHHIIQYLHRLIDVPNSKQHRGA
jgi:hypothetical protein